jgi:hypothetical protein
MRKNIITTKFVSIYQINLQMLNNKRNYLVIVKAYKVINLNKKIKKKPKKDKFLSMHLQKLHTGFIEQMHLVIQLNSVFKTFRN